MTKRKGRCFKMIYLFIAFAVGLALYIHLGPKLSNMEEGMWEITIESKVPGSDIKKPVKFTQCLTKNDPVPDVSIPGYECRLFRKRHPVSVLGNYVIWKIHCEGPEPVMNGNARIRYKGDAFKGRLNMHTIEKEQKRFNINISGNLTGPCK